MQTYIQRSKLQANPVGRKLFEIMEQKQSNLAISADVTSQQALADIADQVGPHICLLKTHIDIIEDFDLSLVDKLRALAEQHNFLIFEDRKFADVGNTVKLQYEGGPFKTSSWADMVNFHLLSGPGVLDGLRAASCKNDRAFIVISEMSSKGNLLTADYSKSCVELAEENKEDVIGFICVSRQTKNPQFLHLTPGVKLEAGSDGLGQQYLTPRDAIVENGCDIIIVGRGIIESDHMVSTAQRYQEAGWQAYQEALTCEV